MAQVIRALPFAAASPRPVPLRDVRTLWEFLSGPDPLAPTDVLFCFGSAHLGVARRAARLYRLGVSSRVLVTGGARGAIPPHRSEAETYAAVLLAEGVPADRIVIEPLALNTGENVAMGMQALQRSGILVTNAGLVAWPPSLRRAQATFTHAFPGVPTLRYPAFAGLGAWRGDHARAALWALDEMERLRAYPRLGFMAVTEIPSEVASAEERLRDLIASAAT
ncbi:MAG TPA: YdcF family protein [Actinomycetota bacterium]|nr:YdcF family protein [Actinomycetota bacterium]